MSAAKNNNFPTYKGKPLVRSGNTLYYGDPSQRRIAMMQVITTKSQEDMTIADRVSVKIIATDGARVIKNTEKNGLYNALNIAGIWLERELRNN